MYCAQSNHFLIRFMASSQSARSPKAVKRIYPSPLGPKPTPGVPTTLASYSICSKNFHELTSPGAFTQRGAEAIYTPEGKKQVKAIIQYYMANARIMKEALESTGLKVFGGENAPYLWVKTPGEVNSWKFFEQMLYEANVVGTPGVGFGPSGEGYIRLTAFGERADCEEAMKRIRKWLL